MTQSPLTHASEAKLASAVHENLFALFRSLKNLPGGEVLVGEKLSFHHAFPANPMFKGVWRARLSPAETGAAIDTAIAWFEQRQAPYFLWWTDPLTQPADLNERLLRRGFDGHLVGDPGMAANLRALNTDVQKPEGFSIVQAHNRKTLEDWRDVFMAAYGTPVSQAQAWVEATAAAGLEHTPERAPWQMYTGYLDGQPVATSMLFKGAGVAGIYAVGTLPAARRQGLGAAITLQPLLDARAQGYRYAVLFSSRLGYRVYQRLGFHEVESKIGIYIWEKE